MYVSRLTFHTLPGKTQEAESKLMTLRGWVEAAGGVNPRIMRTHFGSSGAPDLVFEQEVTDPAILEEQIHKVTSNPQFQEWTQDMSSLLEQPSKRELYTICDGHKAAAAAKRP
jgi:hypothetical protein